MPSRWVINLAGRTGPSIPPQVVHAVVSRWLDDDHRAPSKPYAVSPPDADDHSVTLQVRLLDDALAGRLVDEVPAGLQVRLGHRSFQVTDAPRLLTGIPWDDLIDRSSSGSGLPTRKPCRAWEVRFVSPTTFRKGSRTSPWPSPDSVLTGLMARWQNIAPESAPSLSPVQMRSVWVSDVDGRSHVQNLRNSVVSGFVGRIRYVCDGTPDEAAEVDALLRFADYAGIGSYTAFGLGDVVVEQSSARLGGHHLLVPGSTGADADDGEP